MKIICIGRNYSDHAKELNNPVPVKPLVFMKPDTAILRKGRPFYYPEFSKEIHYEAEVVLKVCKNGRHVEEQFAHKYYSEITLGLDMTARDLQSELKKKGHPWEIAKAFDSSAVIGEFIPMEGFDPKAITFHLNKNGEAVQNGNTKDLIFPFAHLISYVSKYFKLHIGDLIFTGTPAGVGPITIGDKYQGFIGDQQVLKCEIR